MSSKESLYHVSLKIQVFNIPNNSIHIKNKHKYTKLTIVHDRNSSLVVHQSWKAENSYL